MKKPEQEKVSREKGTRRTVRKKAKRVTRIEAAFAASAMQCIAAAS